MANSFTFQIFGLDEDLGVSAVYGEEHLSKPYEFTIEFRSQRRNIRDCLMKRAVLTITVDNRSNRYHGIVTSFIQVRSENGYFYYQTLLGPKLRLLDLNRRSDVFTNKALYRKNDQDNILDTILDTRNGLLPGIDYEIRILDDNLPQYAPDSSGYNRWTYCCQYEETDLDFLSRLLEREGIYYYFDQNPKDRDGKPLDQERIVFTDTRMAHDEAAQTFQHRPTGELRTGPSSTTYQDLAMKQFMLPKTVTLTNYHYEQSAKGILSVTKPVTDSGMGDIQIHGENFYSADGDKDGTFLARIRAQEILCRGVQYDGTGEAVPMTAGMLVHLVDTNPDYTGEYLVTRVEHRGTQPLPGPSGSLPPGSAFTYGNEFTCIPSDCQFRPERQTPKPKITGTLNAFIAGDSDIPLDGQGRYRVELPFTGGVGAMKRSANIRMAYPYAGANSQTYGMHLPLHKGAEVTLAFRDGDPDLPVISGAVFNSLNLNPVTWDNQKKHIIKTPGGNQIIMDDTPGGESMYLYTPHSGGRGNWIYLGKSGQGAGEYKGDKGDKGDKGEAGEKGEKGESGAEEKHFFGVKSSGNKHEVVMGQEDSIVLGSENYITIGSKSELMVGTQSEFTLAMKSVFEAAGTLEFKYGHHLEFGKTTERIKDEDELLGTEKVALGAGLPAAEKVVLGTAAKVGFAAMAAAGAVLAALGGDLASDSFPEEKEGHEAMNQMWVSTAPISAGILLQVVALGILVKKIKTKLVHAISKIEMDDSGVIIHTTGRNSLGTPNRGIQLGIGPMIATPTSFIKIEPTLLNNERIILNNNNSASFNLLDGDTALLSVTNAGSLSIDANAIEITKANNGGQVILNAAGGTMEQGAAKATVTSTGVPKVALTVGNDGFTATATEAAMTCGGKTIKITPANMNIGDAVMIV